MPPRTIVCVALLCAVVVTGVRGFVGTRGMNRETLRLKSEFDFGFEQGHIAGNLARGDGYSMRIGSGPAIPTAWSSPLYPLMLAGIFRAFGAFTVDAAIAVIWLNAAFHGIVAAFLWLLGTQLSRGAGFQPVNGGAPHYRIALAAVVLFFVMPAGWQFLHWAWCIHLLAALIMMHLWAITSPKPRPVAAGVTLGLAMLTDAAAMMLLPVTLVSLWRAWTEENDPPNPPFTRGGEKVGEREGETGREVAVADRIDNGHRCLTVAARIWDSNRNAGGREVFFAAARKDWRGPSLFVISLLLVLAPWAVRNGRVLGSYSPLRGVVGTSLWLGNHPGALAEDYHGLAENPWHNPDAAARYVRLGERGFEADNRRRFCDEARRDPAALARNCAMRASGFWLGEWWKGWRDYPWPLSAGIVAMTLLGTAGLCIGRRRRLPLGVYAGVLILYPLPYYATFLSFGRYRFPIEAVLCLLGAIALTRGGNTTAPACDPPIDPDRPAV